MLGVELGYEPRKGLKFSQIYMIASFVIFLGKGWKKKSLYTMWPKVYEHQFHLICSSLQTLGMNMNAHKWVYGICGGIAVSLNPSVSR